MAGLWQRHNSPKIAGAVSSRVGVVALCATVARALREAGQHAKIAAIRLTVTWISNAFGHTVEQLNLRTRSIDFFMRSRATKIVPQRIRLFLRANRFLL